MAAIEASPTVTWKVAASCTSSGSMTRMLAADAKAATDRKTMARLGVGRAGAAGEDIGSGLSGLAAERKG